MKRFFKTLSVLFFALCIGIFSIIAYGSNNLPDSISATDSFDDIGGIYSVSCSGDVESVGAVANGAQYGTQIRALRIFPIKKITVDISKRKYVAIGGEVFGIKLYTKGAIVVNVDAVTTSHGNVSPGSKAGIKVGDVITHAGEFAVENSDMLTKAIERSQGEPVELTVIRNGESLAVKLQPVMSVDGQYRAGIWVRDSSAGIGTVTFYDDEKMCFAGLGHGVCDVDTGEIMPLSQGEAVRAKVNGFYKSSSGNPGELCGIFTDVSLGGLRVNHETGVYGELRQPSGKQTLPVALESEVKLGKAQIVASVEEGKTEYYDIEITKIYPDSDSTVRNMIIKITDTELLEKTGGILRGMSGSPIIQDSMLVGAVTHVFVNNPEQGYAIFAQKMIETMDSLDNEDTELVS